MIKILLIGIVCSITSAVVWGQSPSVKKPTGQRQTMINRYQVDHINGKPFDFYLNHKHIDEHAKLFYKGQYALDDTDDTFNMLDSVLTDNAETRPFYLFVFNQAMAISDGAVSEYVSGLCKRYLEKYPCEFLLRIADSRSGIDVKMWAALTAAGFVDKEAYNQWVVSLDKKVNMNCQASYPRWKEVKEEIQENNDFK